MQNASSNRCTSFKLPGSNKLQRTHESDETERVPHHSAQEGMEAHPVEVLERTPPTQEHRESKMTYQDMLCCQSPGLLSRLMYYRQLPCAFPSLQDQ